MPRPDDVTDEQIQAWLAKGKKEDEDGPKYALPLSPGMLANRDVAMCAGYWLDEKLQATTNLDAAAREMICFSNGQITFGRDPWEVARITLERAQNGVNPPPSGRALAEDLMQGKLDEVYGPGPGVHSPEAIERMKKAMGLEKLSDLIALTGSKTVKEARAKIRADLKQREETLPKGSR